jgi:hypothetical protein
MSLARQAACCLLESAFNAPMGKGARAGQTYYTTTSTE